MSFDLSYQEYSISGLGSRRFSVTAKGPGGHSWDDRGRSSAIEKIMQFLLGLKARQGGLAERHLAQFSFNIGIINGGEGVNIIAANAEVHFEFREHLNPFSKRRKLLLPKRWAGSTVTATASFLKCFCRG